LLPSPASACPIRSCPAPPRARGNTLKRHLRCVDLAGNSELALLNELCIAHLRKQQCPPQARALFFRIWQEEATAILAELPTRWLISSAITFGDHGRTEGERRLGQSLNMLFSLMKLCEYERIAVGLPTGAPVMRRKRADAAQPLGMGAFSPISGGLDVTLLAPVWRAPGAEPVLVPRLMDMLNSEEDGLFRQLNLLREATAERKASVHVRQAARTVPKAPPAAQP